MTKVKIMTRLVQERRSTIQQTRDGLAALSSPRQYLEFALNNKLTGEQVREVAFSFLRRFGQHAPKTFSFSNIQTGTAAAQEELIALLAQAANNYGRNEFSKK